MVWLVWFGPRAPHRTSRFASLSALFLGGFPPSSASPSPTHMSLASVPAPPIRSHSGNSLPALAHASLSALKTPPVADSRGNLKGDANGKSKGAAVLPTVTAAPTPATRLLLPGRVVWLLPVTGGSSDVSARGQAELKAAVFVPQQGASEAGSGHAGANAKALEQFFPVCVEFRSTGLIFYASICRDFVPCILLRRHSSFQYCSPAGSRQVFLSGLEFASAASAMLVLLLRKSEIMTLRRIT